MIFEQLILDNFGIYQGRHTLKLTPPTPQKPIILLGGLNGSGKTTLLEALQLILYGKFTKYSNQINTPYSDYLRQMINHHADPNQGAALELKFKHYRAGREEAIRIQRSWSINSKQLREKIEVTRDGILDPIMTDHWYEYVEELIPARIANLFFFDGEKIAAFAHPDKAAELLKTGVEALLGLDLVARLSSDLLMIERKRKVQLQSQPNRDYIIALEKQIEQLNQQLYEIKQQQTETNQQLKQARQKQHKLTEEYRREGGELFERKTFLTAQLDTARHQQLQLEEQLRELASGEAPLLLVPELLYQTERQALQEQQAQHNQEIAEALEQHNATLLQLLKQHATDQTTLAVVANFMNEDKVKRQHTLQTECYLQVEPTIFAGLQTHFLTQLQLTINTVLDQTAALENEINHYERQLMSIPDPERLEVITQQRQYIQQEIEQCQSQLTLLEQTYQRLNHDIIRKQNELHHAYDQSAEEQFTHEITQRILHQAEQARNTLTQFNQAMTTKYIRQLETLILDSFHQLIRKKHLIHQIVIDPHQYTLTLYTTNHDILTPTSLSAGERQLLAVAILWGLSRASGYPLPAIIDTPLSRLDSQHRNNLINHYFPQASHQVILLSTDEEINEMYHHHLKPKIGREYHITYQEDKYTSVINSGYFFN